MLQQRTVVQRYADPAGTTTKGERCFVSFIFNRGNQLWFHNLGTGTYARPSAERILRPASSRCASAIMLAYRNLEHSDVGHIKPPRTTLCALD